MNYPDYYVLVREQGFTFDALWSDFVGRACPEGFELEGAKLMSELMRQGRHDVIHEKIAAIHQAIDRRWQEVREALANGDFDAEVENQALGFLSFFVGPAVNHSDPRDPYRETNVEEIRGNIVTRAEVIDNLRQGLVGISPLTFLQPSGEIILSDKEWSTFEKVFLAEVKRLKELRATVTFHDPVFRSGPVTQQSRSNQSFGRATVWLFSAAGVLLMLWLIT